MSYCLKKGSIQYIFSVQSSYRMAVKMANNDYNYYKSEYGKFKSNYYTPGNNNKNNRNGRNSGFKKFIRAFLVFLIAFAILASLIFGGVKIYQSIKNKSEQGTDKPTTTVSQTDPEKTTKPQKTTEKETTTKAPETTTKKPVETTTKQDTSINNKPYVGAIGYIDTDDNSGVFLRTSPTYDISGYAPLIDGTQVVLAEISEDGKWGKTSNFDINGWIYLDYFVMTSTASSTTASSSSSSSSSTSSSGDLTFGQALEIFGNSTEKNLFMNCVIVSSGAVSGVADYANASSGVNSTFSNGDKVEIYSVRDGYGKTRIGNGDIVTWIPTSYLDFVSWGHY